MQTPFPSGFEMFSRATTRILIGLKIVEKTEAKPDCFSCTLHSKGAGEQRIVILEVGEFPGRRR